MKIAILGGAGDIGEGFAPYWAENHHIHIGSHKTDKAEPAAECAIEVFEYTPNQIKQAVTRSGSTDKNQMQKVVGMLSGIDESILIYAADALTAAICHANSM